MAQKRVKSTGAQVLKNIIKATKELETDQGTIKGSIRVKSSADFTDLKNITRKFPEAAKSCHLETLKFVAEELKLALNAAMASKVWQWDYGDGDIIDTGALIASLQVTIDETGINIVYGEEYAAYVYYGAYINPYGNPFVKIYMPPRPWIKSVLLGGGPVEKFNFTGAYRKFFESCITGKVKDVNS